MNLERIILASALLALLTGCTGSLGLDDRGLACDSTLQCDEGKICVAGECTFPESVCGNNIVEPGETCDGNCVTTCSDAIACTTDVVTGDADSCNPECTHTAIEVCVSDDGCCPVGCTYETDNDCSATCGNGIVDPEELCDGNCPTTCDDGVACTADNLVGSADNCTAQCVPTTITECVEEMAVAQPAAILVLIQIAPRPAAMGWSMLRRKPVMVTAQTRAMMPLHAPLISSPVAPRTAPPRAATSIFPFVNLVMAVVPQGA